MKKLISGKKAKSILAALAIIVVGGIILKVIADNQSRIEYE